MKRRDFIRNIGLAGVASATILPSIGFAAEVHTAEPFPYDAALKAVTGGKSVTPSSKVSLKAPEIAENGAVVPVTVEVDSPMTANNYVKTIHIFATKNGNSRCAAIHLTPANGKAYFSSRIKLGQSQDISAVVEMSDGTFLGATQNVKVTIGGCG
jgi:sulfur-oxidizing protein SoxY